MSLADIQLANYQSVKNLDPHFFHWFSSHYIIVSLCVLLLDWFYRMWHKSCTFVRSSSHHEQRRNLGGSLGILYIELFEYFWILQCKRGCLRVKTYLARQISYTATHKNAMNKHSANIKLLQKADLRCQMQS